MKLRRGRWRNTSENVRGSVSFIYFNLSKLASDSLRAWLHAEDEHGKLRGQIEQLKTALEHAQMIRRQKIEYDAVAERLNTLPSRQELEQ